MGVLWRHAEALKRRGLSKVGPDDSGGGVGPQKPVEGTPHGRRRSEVPARQVRTVGPSPHRDNTATSSKYTAVSFLPLALFGQFRRFANLYFLLVGLLMYFGERTGLFLSPYPAATTLAPLGAVIAVSLLQEATTDLARHRADATENRRPTEVLNPTPEVIPRSQVRTGAVVKVSRGEQVPADLVVLATSTPTGVCYVDTASIDGETSLKLRRAPPLDFHTTQSPGDDSFDQIRAIMSTIDARVDCDPPNEHIAAFAGTLTVVAAAEGSAKKTAATKTPAVIKKELPLGKDHVVLRGSSLHTEWLVGVAVYTGADTKLALNARTPPQKLSRLDRVCNRVVLAIFACQLGLAALTACLQRIFEDSEFHNLWYVGYAGHDSVDRRWPDLETTSSRQPLAWSFCTFLILYCNFIPLSLYVSLELCFLVLVFLVNWDIESYHPDTDTPASARSPTVTDLGQVQYVFSDKTGTLTRNEMKLRRVIVGDATYVVPDDDIQSGASSSTLATGDPYDDSSDDSSSSEKNAAPLSSLTEKRTSDPNSRTMLEALTLCNSVVVEVKQDGVQYQAESPDEGALVEGAASAGYRLAARTELSATVETPDGTKEWRVLATNSFDNDRKRMSVFVQSRGSIELLCKGADNSMFEISERDDPRLKKSLDSLSRLGLRTLVVGSRVWTQNEFESWRANHYAPALAAVHDRDAKLRKASIAAEKRGVSILGATAVEDKLQLGVPEAIATMARAGIKLWVLTGDKRETAIEIGRACRLLRPGMPLAVLSAKADPDQLGAALLALYDRVGGSFVPRLQKDRDALQNTIRRLRSEQASSSSKKFGDCVVWNDDDDPLSASKRSPSLPQQRGIVIDGEAMAVIFQSRQHAEHTKGDAGLEAMLFAVLAECASVVACRTTPKQKAQLVKLVQKHVEPTPVTLAIGDGANDVNMIMSAQVGVGISGHEGLQAVNASDFAVAQFRFLVRLLLVHGRWGYRRVCTLVLYSFYKNACLAATLFIYTNLTGYSGTSLFSDYFTAFFNFFLFLEIFYASIFDQDVPQSYVLQNPELYASGRDNMDLNVPVALQWIALAVVHAAVIFFLPAAALKCGTGLADDLSSYQAFGAVVSCGFIGYMNLKVLFETRYFTRPLSGAGRRGGSLGVLPSTWFAVAFNVAFFYFGMLIASAVGDETSFIFQMLPFWHVGLTVLAQPSTWALTFLVVAACATVDLARYACILYFFPSPVAVAVERQRLLGGGHTVIKHVHHRNDKNANPTSPATTASSPGRGGPRGVVPVQGDLRTDDDDQTTSTSEVLS